MNSKKDIENREDLLLLMQEFYKKLLADKSINYLFTDVAKINLAHHLHETPPISVRATKICKQFAVRNYPRRDI